MTARDGTNVYVATEPVTNFQYNAFVTATGFPAPPTVCRDEFSQPEKPVVGVTWFEASAYASWVGGRLPTEEEWMCAAGYRNAKSDYATALGEITPRHAHYACAFASGSPVAPTHFAPTPGGFFNLCGNTWDWCSSNDGPYRVIKGGGFMDSREFCSIQARYRNAPLDRDCTVGFRIVVK
jgi:formylglycine-generating enzyme required for sulfatase activity